MSRLTQFLVAASVAALCVSGLSFDALARPGDGAKVRTYTVQPGDSIWSIAEEFYGSGEKYRLVYQYNKFIGSPPYILKPGQVLTLPVGAISPEARVDWTKRQVKAKPPRSLDWLNANNQMNLWKLYQVSTGDSSAVHIVFEDASDIQLGEEALLVIYGGTSKTARKKEFEKTQVLLKQGTMRGGLAALDDPPTETATPNPKTPGPLKNARSMVVETLSGVVELFSRSTQIETSADAAIVSVHDGEATVKASGSTVKVKRGFGTVVKKGKKPEEPTPLPPPPEWEVAGDGKAVAIVPEGGRASFEASWRAVKGAAVYRIQLSSDEDFKQVAVDAQIPAANTRFVMQRIPAGTFYARVSARDGRGLEGQPTSALRLDVVGLDSSRPFAARPDETYEVVGLTRLGLGTAAEDLEWSLDDGAFLAGPEPLRVATPGTHRLRVHRAGETVESVFSFDLIGVRGSFEVPDAATADPHAETGTTYFRLVDERGRPTALPELRVTAGKTILQPKAVGPGRWKVTYPLDDGSASGFVRLKAHWADLVLAEVALATGKGEPVGPYAYRWKDAPIAIPWRGLRASTRMPGLTPIDRVGLQLGGFASASGDVLSASVTGELGLLGGDLGLDAALTFFQAPLDRDPPRANEFGDLSLGVRYPLVSTPKAGIGLSVRGRVVPGARPEDPVGGALEPSFLADWHPADSLTLTTRQAVNIAGLGSVFPTEVDWAADYHLAWRPVPLLALHGRLSTALPLSAKDAETATEGISLGAGFGAQLHLDRIRLGFEFGLGLNATGQRRYGDFMGVFSFELGLGTPAP